MLCAEVSPGSIRAMATKGAMGVKGAAQSPAQWLGTASLCFLQSQATRFSEELVSALILPARRPVWTPGHLPQRL